MLLDLVKKTRLLIIINNFKATMVLILINKNISIYHKLNSSQQWRF